MKLATFLPPGSSEAIAGEIRDEQAITFSDGTTVKDRLAIGGGAPADGQSWRLDAVELSAPVPAPGSIYCVALNYRAHAKEAGMPLPERPIVFLKQSDHRSPASAR